MRLPPWLGICLLASACAGCGAHLHNEENAKLAQSAKIEYEKVNLLALASTERENLAALHTASLTAVRESQIHERDQVFFSAASKTSSDARLQLLELPSADSGGGLDCRKLHPSYVARRACVLGAKTREALGQLGSHGSITAQAQARRRLVEKQMGDLKKLGWSDVPDCAHLTMAMPDIAKARVTPENLKQAEDNFKELVANCSKLGNPPATLLSDWALLEQLDEERAALAAGSKGLDEQIKDLSTRLKLLAAGRPKQGDTRQKIMEAAAALREAVGGVAAGAKVLGAESSLADLRIDAAETLLLAAEGGTIPDEKLEGDDEKTESLRRAVLVAQTVPLLADELRQAASGFSAPSQSSLLIAQRQALIDKEYLSAQTVLLRKRQDIVLRRIAAVGQEARLLSQASRQHADAQACGRETACIDRHVLIGYNYISRSLLTAKSEQEATKWEETHLDGQKRMLANEYALKSWDNLIGTPIVLLDGYHSGGVKPEALADLIIKIGGLGLLGIITTRVN